MKTNKHRCRYRERLDELSEMVLMMAWNTDVAHEAIDIARKCLLIPYCELYDQGFERIGCIGCPMGSKNHRLMEFERYQKYKEAYIRAFDKMIERKKQVGGGITEEEWFIDDGREFFEEWWFRSQDEIR